jgi:hypothetical protein
VGPVWGYFGGGGRWRFVAAAAVGHFKKSANEQSFLSRFNESFPQEAEREGDDEGNRGNCVAIEACPAALLLENLSFSELIVAVVRFDPLPCLSTG